MQGIFYESAKNSLDQYHIQDGAAYGSTVPKYLINSGGFLPSGKIMNGIKRVAIVPRTTAAMVMIACVVVIVILQPPPVSY